ncbi:MAG TPA: S4 domain-containing protein, partial [Desulfurivibrionaceae bacterium]|nr:S4 domain-containing protein [Desulfurivibrionaceae bacterium]
LLSDLSSVEIDALREGLQSGQLHPKTVKQQLARELAGRFHGGEAAQQAEAHFEKVFSRHELPDEIEEVTLKVEGEAIWLPKLLAEGGLVKGTGEGRRMIQQGGVILDGEKVTDVEFQVPATGEVLLKVGKRRFARVRFA